MSRKMTPRSRKWFGILFSGFAGIFLAVGSGMAWHQGHRIAVSQPVPATIETTRIDSARGSKGGTSYTPVVEFRYRVDGQDYRGDDPLPMTVSSSSYESAQAVTTRFSPGQEVTAWYAPANPGSAFLLKEPSFFPYIFMLFPMIHAAAGLAMVLFAEAPVHRRPARMAILAAVWCGVGLVAGGHYAAIGGAWTRLPLIAMGVYGALGAGLIIAWRVMASKVARSAVPEEPASGFVDEPNPFRQS